ncbi:MAG: DUF4912 domain-containing protein [Treponema sp.]|nr:DUF4912 domain-containing protein [Treponema sp.]
MKEEAISRAYLETLSFSDLVRLADEYGVDVPEDLDRRFLIEELLEIIEEESNNNAEEMIISSGDTPDASEFFTGNYNETQVSGVLRNPAWLFVFWNISDADSAKLKDIPGCELKLRICFLKDPKDSVPEEAFEVQTSSDSQEQYVLIPAGKKYIKIELVYVTASSGKVMAFSPVITIPQGAAMLNDLQLGRQTDFSPIIELSGMKTILTEHYKNHRHSF